MGSDEVKVYVVASKSHPCYRLRWRDPATGKWVYKTSEVENDGRKKSRQRAHEVAGKLATTFALAAYFGMRLTSMRKGGAR